MNANNTQLVTAQVAQALRSDDMQKQMGAMLPPSVSLDRFTEVTIAAIQNNPEVLQADRDSLYRACVQAARRGLLPDKREGALVIYNTNVGTRDQPRWMKLVQFLPMVEGVIKEMAKAGINAFAVSVHENDKISFWNDDKGQHVHHEPLVFGDRGKMVGVFAAAITSDGRPYVEAMALQDVAQVARRSKQCSVDNKTGEVSYGGAWKSDFDRMAQKSALHRLRKRLPITDEDALENLKDMEETTDIDPAATQAPAASTPAAMPDASSPPPAQNALPAPDTTQDEVLKPAARTRAPRRSRTLEGVLAQNKATEAARAPEQAKKTDTPAPSAKPTSAPPPAEPEYSEDDIV